jgi:hypothetical protein
MSPKSDRGIGDRVLVRRSPDSPGWEVLVGELSGLHWAAWSGGHGNFFRDSGYMLAAYIECTLIPKEIQSDWGHDCKINPPPPHRIKVLIQKKKRYAVTYADLAAEANERYG